MICNQNINMNMHNKLQYRRVNVLGGIIQDLFLGIFSDFLRKKISNYYKNYKIKRFSKKLMGWCDSFVNKYRDTVVDTDDFAKFIKNNNIVENIIFHILPEKEGEVETKNEFIKHQISKFQFDYNKKEYNSEESNSILEEFFEYLYSEISNFYFKRLSDEYKFLLKQIYAGNKEIKDELNIIKNELSNIESLDSESIQNIYFKLSHYIFTGKISDVEDLLLLFENKKGDLTISIKFLLSIFKDDGSPNKNELLSLNKISDEKIYNDVCRNAIYLELWKNRTNHLLDIGTKNTHLNSLVRRVCEKKREGFLNIAGNAENGNVAYSTLISKEYPSEQWLVNRICAIEIVNPISDYYIKNFLDVTLLLIGESNNLLDKIIVLESRAKEIYSKQLIDKKEIRAIHDESINLKNCCTDYSLYIQQRVYAITLRTALIISEELAYSIYDETISKESNNEDIELLHAEIQSRRGDINLNELTNICSRYNQYWPLNNYFTKIIHDDPVKIKDIIENHMFLLEKDLDIFVIYVQLVNQLEGENAAIEVLGKYKNKYENYQEYWVLKLQIQHCEKDFKTVADKIKNDKLYTVTSWARERMISLLLEHELYETVLKMVDVENEEMSVENLRIKAICLFQLNKEIEALNIFQHIFDSGCHSEEMLYYILMLSVSNCREVSLEVMSCADKSKDIRILKMLYLLYFKTGDYEKAERTILTELFLTQDPNSDVFNRYIKLSVNMKNIEEKVITYSTDNTVVHIESMDKAVKKKFAIHSKKILPKDCYFFEGVEHVYTETAIDIGVFRKKVEDKIIIDEICYSVKSIESLAAFLFRVCTGKMISNGTAKGLEIPLDCEKEDDTKEVLEQIKDLIGDKGEDIWVEKYKDLTQVPFSINCKKDYMPYFQLASILLEDSTLFYRDGIDNHKITIYRKYILSYSAIVLLYKIGWETNFSNIDFMISESSLKTITSETEKIIQNLNRDMVSRIRVNDDKVYIYESMDIEKEYLMKDAVSFKKFASKFSLRDNNYDLQIDYEYIEKIKNHIGVEDYDALVIAKSENACLVSGEPIISVVSSVENLDITSTSVCEFVTNLSTEVDNLLTYVEKMAEYRFLAPFTANTIRKIHEFYLASEVEKQEEIIVRLEKIFETIDNLKGYTENVILILKECLDSMKEEYSTSAIYKCLSQWLNNFIISYSE